MLPHWLIKLGFHLLYNQMAWSYDLIAWLVSFGQWAAWRRLVLQFLQPGPTLELAYGTGGLFVDLMEADHQPVGIDRSPYMAKLTKNRLRQHQLPVRINRAMAQALPFPSACFSNVVATFPTNYIFQDKTLVEIKRMLVPGGQLVVVMEGHLRGPWPLRPFIDWLYKITNQREFHTTRPLSAFAKQGLPAKMQMVECQGVQARLLFARKNSADG